RGQKTAAERGVAQTVAQDDPFLPSQSHGHSRASESIHAGAGSGARCQENALFHLPVRRYFASKSGYLQDKDLLQGLTRLPETIKRRSDNLCCDTFYYTIASDAHSKTRFPLR